MNGAIENTHTFIPAPPPPPQGPPMQQQRSGGADQGGYDMPNNGYYNQRMPPNNCKLHEIKKKLLYNDQ